MFCIAFLKNEIRHPTYYELLVSSKVECNNVIKYCSLTIPSSMLLVLSLPTDNIRTILENTIPKKEELRLWDKENSSLFSVLSTAKHSPEYSQMLHEFPAKTSSSILVTYQALMRPYIVHLCLLQLPEMRLYLKVYYRH